MVLRVKSLALSSPVMCFLTGITYVLRASQHWEEVAHSGVSLANSIEDITGLIECWGKLEVQGWQKCFETSRSKYVYFLSIITSLIDLTTDINSF